MKKVILALSVLAFAGISYAAEVHTETLLIEKKYKSCMENAQSNADFLNCSYTASENMDKLLNQLYKKIMDKLPANKKEILKNAQKKWLAFRDAEKELSWALDPMEGGTGQNTSAADFSYQILKERTEDFEGYFYGLEM
jgi:uncharacterized protein YecT (DUF1311 family)